MVVAAATETNTWEWGWEALVAIGTIGLAVVTALLAVATFLMARTAGIEVRQGWRPVIVPASDVEVAWIPADKLVQLTIRNVGQGPAYDVDAGLDLGHAVVPAESFIPDEPEPMNFTVIPAGDATDVWFAAIATEPKSAELLVDYSDANGRRYGSRIEIRTTTAYLPKQEVPILRMTRVTHSEGEVVVPYNDVRNYGRRGRMRVRLNRVRTLLGLRTR